MSRTISGLTTTECRKLGGRISVESGDCLMELDNNLSSSVSEMNSRNVDRGERFEQKIVARLKRSNCITSIRSIGSRGTWDIICIAPDKVRLIQAKANGFLEPSLRDTMLSELMKMPSLVQAEVEYYESPKVSVGKIIKKAGETDWDKVRERLDFFKVQRGFQERMPTVGFQEIFKDKEVPTMDLAFERL